MKTPNTHTLIHRAGHEPHNQAHIYQEDGDGRTVAITYNDDGGQTAEEIVRRYNAYADLLAALKDAHAALAKVAEMCNVHNPHTGFRKDVNPYGAYGVILPSLVKPAEIKKENETI